MKRLIPAAVIFALIIVVCIISDISIRKSVKNAENKINKCEILYLSGQFEEAQNSAEDFKRHWIETSRYISAYSNHCPLDDISVLAAILPEATAARNDFEFKSTVSQIQMALYTVYREQTFTLESLY